MWIQRTPTKRIAHCYVCKAELDGKLPKIAVHYRYYRYTNKHYICLECCGDKDLVCRYVKILKSNYPYEYHVYIKRLVAENL